jgi:hypothetical protein
MVPVFLLLSRHFEDQNFAQALFMGGRGERDQYGAGMLTADCRLPGAECWPIPSSFTIAIALACDHNHDSPARPW